MSLAVEASRKKLYLQPIPLSFKEMSPLLSRMMYMGANNGLTLEQLVSLGGSPFNMTWCIKIIQKIQCCCDLHKNHNRCGPISTIVLKSSASPTSIFQHGDERMIDCAENGGDLWEIHMDNKKKLIDFVEERNGVKLDADKLLIGFSRRAAPYKRSNFIFTDEKIIDPLLKEGKIQIVFSGKAHPLDDTGKEIVENIVRMSKKYPNAVVFLENYDMTIGAMLTRGRYMA